MGDPVTGGRGGRQSKIVKYELEKLVIDGRRRGRSHAQIAVACNTRLAGTDSITTKAIERYLARLDRETVPAAHQPQVAGENARLAVDVAARLNLLDGKLTAWLDEAETAVIHRWVGGGETGEVVESIDWQARTSVARELRQATEAVVNLLERVHNAERIEAFQVAVVQAIRDADPDTARRVVVTMERHEALRAAALLGARIQGRES
jgi:hypothetical protein